MHSIQDAEKLSVGVDRHSKRDLLTQLTVSFVPYVRAALYPMVDVFCCCVQLSSISCDPDLDADGTSLALHETLKCTAQYVIAQADIDSGFVS